MPRKAVFFFYFIIYFIGSCYRNECLTPLWVPTFPPHGDLKICENQTFSQQSHRVPGGCWTVWPGKVRPLGLEVECQCLGSSCGGHSRCCTSASRCWDGLVANTQSNARKFSDKEKTFSLSWIPKQNHTIEFLLVPFCFLGIYLWVVALSLHRVCLPRARPECFL